MSEPLAPPPSEPYAPSTGAAPGQPVPGKTLGIVAFVLSFFLQLLGLILGIVALVQSRKAGHKNGFALAAIIISAVLGVLALIIGGLIVAGIVAAAQFGVGAIQECQQLGDSGTVEFQGQEVSCSVILDEYDRQMELQQ